MSGYIWSLAQLQELAVHPEPSIQEWAVRKWFLLYPQSAQEHLPQFLGDSRPAVVGAALLHLGVGPRPELVPLLKDIYLHGTAESSAQAIETLGDWRVEEAVAWMKQRILEGEALQAGQIGGMIRALGEIPTAEARDLLKGTESSVNGSDSRHWGQFYVALLNHHRGEDLDRVLECFTEPAREQRRMDAYGVLLSLIDLRLNPTELYYGGGSLMQKHVLDRVNDLDEVLTTDQSAALRGAAGRSWRESSDEERSTVIASGLQPLLDEWRERLDGSFYYQLAVKTAAMLQVADAQSEIYQPLLFLAWMALLAAIAATRNLEQEGSGSWQATLKRFLRDEPPQPKDMALVEPIAAAADRTDMIQNLKSVLAKEPKSWRAVKAMLLLGEVQGVEALPELIHAIGSGTDQYGREAAFAALSKMGEPAVGALLPLLSGTDRNARQMAWDVLSSVPTHEGVRAQLACVSEAYLEDPERTLDRIRLSGAGEFLPFVEAEYRPGEMDLGRTLVLLSHLHGMHNDRLTEVARDVKRLEAQALERHEWPRSFSLELSCTQCRKRYHYEVREIHMHPPEGPEDRAGDDDFVPFHHGFVLRDDIQCKNCAATNAVELTPSSRDRLSAEFIRILAHARGGTKMPASYPIVLTNWSDDQDKHTSLRQIERERLKAIDEHPSKPAAHLGVAKFYEYVKQDGKARKAYLRALDLDTHCLEALAGLGRIDHAGGRHKEALEWMESCYDQLETGRFYLVQDRPEFKKACRDARRQYSRDAGVKPKEAPVTIQYHLDSPEHPKNKPCPCGSGKKY
ncbi:MAG TPA: hypothetical protein DCE18_16990, partial [Syntrophobacteraceae bacterium]|nr:hypothetical protein [Syntrophobacteraceae bacterium]